MSVVTYRKVAKAGTAVVILITVSCMWLPSDQLWTARLIEQSASSLTKLDMIYPGRRQVVQNSAASTGKNRNKHPDVVSSVEAGQVESRSNDATGHFARQEVEGKQRVERPLIPRRKPGDESKYVSLCTKKMTGNHRTGNQLFMLAAMLDLAKRTGRTVVMPRVGWRLDPVFDIDVERVNNVEEDLCPCRDIITPRYNFDDRFNDKKFIENLTLDVSHTLLLCHLSQTYYHARNVEPQLRKLLRFKPQYLEFVQSFRTELRKEGDCQEGECKQVGVHVRGGDYLLPADKKFGLTTVNYGYMKKAMQYFVEKFGKVQFILMTDDWKVTNSIVANLTSLYRIAKSINHNVGQDFTLLSSVDGVLMSTGSFGWWAGWISGKTTVYYEDWPHRGSRMDKEANRERYFPPEWVALL